MKNKKIGLVLLSILLVFAGYFLWSKHKKDKWATETPKIRFSEKREKEVWGDVLRGDDAALFYGTPLYDLADEMSGIFTFFKNQDKIERLIAEIPNELINYQEEKFNLSIGHFALNTGNIAAIRNLLDRGLNPNLIDTGGNALIIDINGPFISRAPAGLETLKYLIKKGGNVNLYSKKAQLKTPLIEAANSNFINVKVLIEAGANPHFIVPLSTDSYRSALSTALIVGRIEIVNYLIFDQKVDFRTLKYPKWSKIYPEGYEIFYFLRNMTFELNTQEYKDKMKLVSYLKTQGLDYWKTPIPENIRTNTEYFTKEYLSKY